MNDTAPAAGAVPVSLDQVMLAMDVVDTLRHQQSLVDAALDDDRRREEFVRRVQAIYESQGIEVSEEVIFEGVRALEENRFVYRPPERTLQVRLAEIYVERGKWAKRAALVLFVVAALWAMFAVPAHLERRNLEQGFGRQVDRLVAVAERHGRTIAQLQEQWQAAHTVDDTAATSRLLDDASAALLRGRQGVTAVTEALTPRPAPADYPDRRSEWDERLTGLSAQAEATGGEIGTARGLLAAVTKLRSLGARMAVEMQRLQDIVLSEKERALVDALQRDVRAAIDGGRSKDGELAIEQLGLRIGEILAARQRQADVRAEFASLKTALDGVDIEPNARQERNQLVAGVQAAMNAADWERAEQQIAALRRLIAVLDQEYELRIVSRPNDQSGVWRYEGNDRSKRNFYIVVEAVGPSGKVLSLPITSEEDQTTRTVRRFAVRVPEAVYEKVKADKLDNGLIDDVVVGAKRRGARGVAFRIQVAGGYITEW